MTAAQARANTDLRARVRVASGASDRTIVDLLDGYATHSTAAVRVRSALEAEGVDLATIPERTSDELQAWKRRRQPGRLPPGYAIDRCGCGRDYPRMLSEPEGRCQKCWRKERDALARALGELSPATPVPILRGV